MEKQLKPAIRFKGFTDPWEQRKVSELFRVTRGYVLAATQTETTKTDEKPYPVYSSQTKDKGLMGYYKDYLYEDAITWTTDGANAGTVNYRTGKFYCTNVCGVLLSNEVKANQMIAEALNNVAKGYVSYVGNPKLMNNVMADIVIQIPTQAEERDKLSSFFASLDNLITLHQRKYDKLQVIKKAMLEKMFPQNGSNVPEIRFRGFTDPWEQRKFMDSFDLLSNNTLSRAELNNEQGAAQNVHYGDILVRFGEVIDLQVDALPYITDEANVSKSTFLQNGDIIIADTAEDTTVGKCVEITGISDTDVVAGLHTIPCRPRNQYAQGYLGYFMNSPVFHNQLLPLMQGTKVTSVSKSALQDTVLYSPTDTKEQALIGDYFIKLDHIITLHQRELEKLQKIKKAMLEKMFV